MKPVTTSDIEIALFDYFGRSQKIVIPNVSYGFRGINYEVDVMIVTQAMYAYEVEIKTSAADLRRDFKKAKWSYCRDQHYFRGSYYAIPEGLLDYIGVIPEYAGIMVVKYSDAEGIFKANLKRKSQIDADAKKITETELAKLGYLASLRMWDFKRTINNRRLYEHKAVDTYLNEPAESESYILSAPFDGVVKFQEGEE